MGGSILLSRGSVCFFQSPVNVGEVVMGFWRNASSDNSLIHFNSWSPYLLQNRTELQD